MKEPTLKEIQATLDEYISQFKEGYFPPLVLLGRMTEELGEVAKSLMYHEGHVTKKKNEEISEISEELMDLLVSVVIMANALEIDLSSTFDQNMKKYRKRDRHRFERNEQDVRKLDEANENH
ncbi:MazG nucleotide pyrophosphohydrolase domain-containing protein [Vagococcus xieshaowenii]|uniref:Nucleotide pyrophosphohydrolase n=2 Tax=Vagococcus xieshaowenii TaxID=2562451 RepID=A0AAJ5EFW7_9ENTE|nr:MazG nucleotide pyrophosphohydrolase domain-containing protein [Vagococcus xieshaowenii]QCA29596.1 nucleotide pyrophosphohydrolase [Vagococcus xieshaowenii]TFZ40665.1 nucleotide pyrophosphohydrolase [Vagococcus xieshaowenii]